MYKIAGGSKPILGHWCVCVLFVVYDVCMCRACSFTVQHGWIGLVLSSKPLSRGSTFKSDFNPVCPGFVLPVPYLGFTQTPLYVPQPLYRTGNVAVGLSISIIGLSPGGSPFY
jgi:hypothetical protein